jgi:DUF4097 and DUF4098 domain-containing protein YvlB
MTMRFRPVMILTVTLLSFAGSACADDWSRQWTTGPNPELRVETGDGSVTVIGTANSNRIEAKVVTKGWKINASEVRIDEHFQGNKLDLTVHVPTIHFSVGIEMRSVQIELHVPQSIASTIHTGDGSIHLQDLKGATRLNTGDGRIEGTGLDGTLEARTGDGSVKLTGRFDGLQVHTNDGKINLQANSGSKMAGTWRVESGDGSVTLAVPGDLAADVEAHTGDGHISFDLPVSLSDKKNENDLRGRINGGGPSLIVRTGDGSIRIVKS